MKSVPLSSQNTVELTTSLPFLQHSLEGRIREEQRAFVAFRSYYLFESHVPSY